VSLFSILYYLPLKCLFVWNAGGVSFVWWIFWNIFVYSSPETHPRIDPIEKNYIMKTVGTFAYEKVSFVCIVANSEIRSKCKFPLKFCPKLWTWKKLWRHVDRRRHVVNLFDVQYVTPSRPFLCTAPRAWRSTYSAVCLRHEGKTIILQKLLSTMAYISAPGYNKHTLIVCLLGRVAPTSLKSSLS